MTADLLSLIASFVIILAGSELFTNGVEWAGERLGVAEAAVGSLLAAVGTALPETLIPAVALVMGGGQAGAHREVGTGAIVGAPLMLSTIALAVVGVAALAFGRRRNRIGLGVPPKEVRHDLNFFLPVFATLLLLGLGHPGPALRRLLALALLCIYGIYAALMLRMERDAEGAVEHGLYLASLLGGNPLRPAGAPIAVQVLLGTGAILFGALEFVRHVIALAHQAGVGPGVLSLVLSPLATELPEKYNGVVWVRQGKDHLALANITGAMVFQSCIPVALGLAFTPWHLSPAELWAGLVALVSSTLLYVNVRDGELGTPALMTGGIAYAAFLAGLGVLAMF